MKTLIAFLFGASCVFVAGWLGFANALPSNATLLTMAWLAGVLVGGWAVGMGMFYFSETVVRGVVARRDPYLGVHETRRFFQERGIPSATPLPEPTLEEVEDGVDLHEDMYDDPDWWKNAQKRERHRRNQNG